MAKATVPLGLEMRWLRWSLFFRLRGLDLTATERICYYAGAQAVADMLVECRDDADLRAVGVRVESELREFRERETGSTGVTVGKDEEGLADAPGGPVDEDDGEDGA